MTNPPSKRFVAGAVCPECQALDRLVLEERETGLIRRCVSCGFADHQVQISSGGVPKGRGDKSAFGVRRGVGKSDQEISPVRIINPATDAD